MFYRGKGYLEQLLHIWLSILQLSGQGCLDSRPSKSTKFQWARRALHCLWALVMIVLQSSTAGFTVYFVLSKTTSQLESIVEAACQLQRMVATVIGVVFYIVVHSKLIHHIEKLDNFIRRNLSMKDKIILTIFVLLTSGICIGLTAVSIYDTVRDPLAFVFYEKYISLIFDQPLASRVICSWLVLSDWIFQAATYSMLFITGIICLATTLCFRRICLKTEKALEEKRSLIDCANEHADLCHDVIELNATLNMAVFVQYATHVLNILNNLNRLKLGSFSRIEGVAEDVAFMSLSTGLFVLVHEAACSIIIPLEKGLRKTVEKEREQICSHLHTLLLRPVAFSIGGFVHINRAFIATLFGGIAAYAILLWELSDKGLSQSDLQKLSELIDLRLRIADLQLTSQYNFSRF